MDKDNANPTILTASQLPTRHTTKKAPVHLGFDADLLSEISRKPSYLSGPFCDVSWSDESETDDDFTDEPIDEQEIYGRFSPFLLFPLPLLPSLFYF